MSKNVKNIIIGFGKAGKTIAAYLGTQGEETVLIEKSPVMYGGTCINVGCIPTKKIATAAARKKYSQEDAASYYQKSIQEKKALIAALNQANYQKVNSAPNVTIVDGFGRFVDEHTVAVDTANGVEEYVAERIFINTGGTPFIPPIEGLKVGGPIHTNETIMDLEEFPESVVIVGSGFIGLEFAATYAQFGSKVTVVDVFDAFIPREDDDVSAAVKERLEEMGVTFELGISVKKVETEDNKATVYYAKNDEEKVLVADAVLVATGRKPNIQGLDLEKAGVELSERGAIKVNEFLQTNKPHIFALGDSTFISPTLSSVGLNEKAAQAAGIPVKVAKLPMAAVPKAKILGNQVGFYKVLVHEQTNEIVGATLFAEESHEVINIIATAIKAKLPYTALRDQIFTHPTMAEALNDVFGLIK